MSFYRHGVRQLTPQHSHDLLNVGIKDAFHPLHPDYVTC